MKMEKLGGRGGGGDDVERARVASEKAIISGGRGGVIMEAVGGGGGRRGTGMRRGHKLASAVNEGFGGGGGVDEIAGVGGVGGRAERRRAGEPPRIRLSNYICCCSIVVDEGGIDRAPQKVRNIIGFMTKGAPELRLLRGAAIA
ncbi:hypothetical protein L7F22_033923 [Adiantum nelumboides]|nr:hypothetical protein [Adiantum nelumboides]